MNIAIIGAGPAGIAAAIQLKRYGIEPLIFEKAELGGLLPNANLIENYPGFPKGISGPGLLKLFKKQFSRHQLNIIPQEVLTLDYKEHLFFIRTATGWLKAKKVIVATGTFPKTNFLKQVPSEIKDKIFYEVATLKKKKKGHVIIIGAGDAAFDYALNLAGRHTITILDKNEQAKCLPLLWQRAQKHQKINYFNHYSVQDIQLKNPSQFLVTCYNKENSSQVLKANYILSAIGRKPALEFIGQKLAANLDEVIQTKKLFMIGDVANDLYRQTAICVGDGVKAAMGIYQSLTKELLY